MKTKVKVKTTVKQTTKFLVILIGISIPFSLLAQTDTAQAVSSGAGFLSKVPTWIPVVLGALYEVIVRLVPTKSNWSVLGFVVRMIQGILPNNSSSQGVNHP
jgi:hypothetical protein